MIKKVTYAPDLFEKAGLEFIDQHKDKPFFLYFATTIPHANDEAAPNGSEVPSLGQYAGKPWPENERGFAAMITLLDTQVGHIMDSLKKNGLDDNTIVIFTSDNGPHSEGGHDAKFFNSAGPLRGIKRDLYEGGIREPMIVRWPGKTPAGTETDHIGYFGDFFATAAEVSGGKLPDDQPAKHQHRAHDPRQVGSKRTRSSLLGILRTKKFAGRPFRQLESGSHSHADWQN